MKRSIYLGVITVITILCIIFSVYRNESDDMVLVDSGKRQEKSEELEEFESLTITADVMDFTVKEGDGYSISYRCSKKLVPEYEVVNGELKITQKRNNKYLPLFNVNNAGCKIVVTVPTGMEFSEMKIQNDVGDIQLENIHIQGSCDVTTDVGDYKMESVTLQDLVIEGNVGDIKLIDCDFVTCDITSDVGDVKIEGNKDFSEYDFDIATDVGDIEIDGEDYGKKYHSNGDEGKITIKSDVGDVDIND